ncbi:phage integrase/site-specific recombinase [Haloferax mucosum ATCC BAA-1512]|uniref:Phage integrase/site-specific recombinase n=1 Tax=Haloferax mucosum ATCC BAA-1512 TaxID=662479 RepID=M0IKQ1_9EURY|nr:site-specific integrase [Haloferax mucosum]ELZ96433.1 phage integrase/site-specific recombinase [Haloferax mucosum ATCC BAA-1512]
MTEPQNPLEPLEPRTAVEMYLNDRRGEVSSATHQSHGYRLERFVEWCDENAIENLNPLTGRDIQSYKISRKRDGLVPTSLKGQLDTLRVFLRFCASINGVHPELPETVNSPSLTDDEKRGTDVIRNRRADRILAHRSKYDYASRKHAQFRLLWATGMRMGAARSIDLTDLNIKNQYVDLHHRPETETPLKNNVRGEREIALDTQTVNVLRDYIDENRENSTDDYGREPLLTTEFGRASDNSVRAWTYQMTRPCMAGMECPHGRKPETCEAVDGVSRMSASKCPDSVAPHAIRRGAITHHLAQDTPTKVVSDRMNVGMDVLEEHYDARSEHEKMEQRRNHLPDI